MASLLWVLLGGTLFHKGETHRRASLQGIIDLTPYFLSSNLISGGSRRLRCCGCHGGRCALG